jgi:hypothetical protein
MRALALALALGMLAAVAATTNANHGACEEAGLDGGSHSGTRGFAKEDLNTSSCQRLMPAPVRIDIDWSDADFAKQAEGLPVQPACLYIAVELFQCTAAPNRG